MTMSWPCPSHVLSGLGHSGLVLHAQVSHSPDEELAQVNSIRVCPMQDVAAPLWFSACFFPFEHSKLASTHLTSQFQPLQSLGAILSHFCS